jgi:hypothetical protein
VGGGVVVVPSAGGGVESTIVVGVDAVVDGPAVAEVVDELSKGTEESPLPQAAATSPKARRMMSLRIV